MMGQPRSWLLIPKHRDKDTAHKIEEAHDADTHCWSGSETTWLATAPRGFDTAPTGS